MKKRFDGYDVYLSDFNNKIYVVCPRCSKQATINKDSDSDYETLSCPNCGYLVKEKYIRTKFDIELWLEINCCGETLWAYNENHLDFLENYVSAKLRERTLEENGWKNRSLASRLPSWIKKANNREKILKCINKLRERIY